MIHPSDDLTRARAIRRTSSLCNRWSFISKWLPARSLSAIIIRTYVCRIDSYAATQLDILSLPSALPSRDTHTPLLVVCLLWISIYRSFFQSIVLIWRTRILFIDPSSRFLPHYPVNYYPELTVHEEIVWVDGHISVRIRFVRLPFCRMANKLDKVKCIRCTT